MGLIFYTIKTKLMKLQYYIPFLFFTFVTFSQEIAGYWDKERITNKEINLSAGNRISVISEDLPIGTTEFVYRITLLDENQKMVNDLASVLKAIPDPYFIGKGTGGAISLISSISGTDTCIYAVFTSENETKNFIKNGLFEKACLYQKNPVSKDVKVISVEKGTCLKDSTRTLWFAFENKNWLMNEKIVLEIVPWIDTKASRGWTATNKNSVLSFIKQTKMTSRLHDESVFLYCIFGKIESEYRFQDFKNLSLEEKKAFVTKNERICLTETNLTLKYNKVIRNEAKNIALAKKQDIAIQLIIDEIITQNTVVAQDYNTLAELYIETKQFDKAMEMLKKAQSLDTSDLLIQLNLAHTYMFLNNIAMAKAIHEQFKNQNISANQTWVNKAINDLDYFKKINLNTSNFKKILRVLE